MNKMTVSKMIFGAVLLLFTACTQDELAEQGTALPETITVRAVYGNGTARK